MGIEVKGGRIDSGDLGEHARKVRAILDAGGLRSVRIVASSGLDEHAIDALVSSGAPIDTFAPVTFPGRKQVNRGLEGTGVIARDHLLLEGEAGEGVPLLEKVMAGGRRLAPSPSLAAVRKRAADGLRSLPEALRSLDPEPAVPLPLIVSSRIETILRTRSGANG